jgi:hypothetical protein
MATTTASPAFQPASATMSAPVLLVKTTNSAASGSAPVGSTASIGSATGSAPSASSRSMAATRRSSSGRKTAT